ncbi:hypothetical protein [Azospirillum argentinense]
MSSACLGPSARHQGGRVNHPGSSGADPIRSSSSRRRWSDNRRTHAQWAGTGGPRPGWRSMCCVGGRSRYKVW